MARAPRPDAETMPVSRTLVRVLVAGSLLLAAPAASQAAQSPRAPRVAHIAVPSATVAPRGVDVRAVVAHHRALARKGALVKRGVRTAR